jgi:hypothetical protein
MSDYVPKTNAEIKAIAMDIISSRIFTSDHCRTPEDIGRVFMPLAMLSEDQRAKMIEENYTFFYEEHSKGLPRGVNGLPMFTSMQALNQSDHARLGKVYAALRAALDAVPG